MKKIVTVGQLRKIIAEELAQESAEWVDSEARESELSEKAYEAYKKYRAAAKNSDPNAEKYYAEYKAISAELKNVQSRSTDLKRTRY